MGCCASSSKTSKSPSAPKNNPSRTDSSDAKINGTENMASSHAPMEEETVKEVLSETPFLKRPPPNVQLLADKESQDLILDEFKEEVKFEEKLPINAVEEFSEVSEICSLSESISTTTITDKMDDNEEVRSRVNRSPAKLPKNRFPSDVGPRKDRLFVGRSPTRRSDQSPGRKNGGVSARLVQTRDAGQGTARRNGLRGEPNNRRDPGEKSARRSTSPAISRTDGAATRSSVGRSQSIRRSGTSPGRAPMAPPPDISHKETEELNSIEGYWPTNNESLENPLVSLECFIFL